VYVGVKVAVYRGNPHRYYSSDARSYFWAGHCYADSRSSRNDSHFLSVAGRTMTLKLRLVFDCFIYELS